MENLSNFDADFSIAPLAELTDPSNILGGSQASSLNADKTTQALPFGEQERVNAAHQLLEEHAIELQQTFTTAESWQGFLFDIFQSNAEFQSVPTDRLEALRDDFGAGVLQPDIDFVAADVLLGPEGQQRSAAFDQNSETILLADNLDIAEIEAGIVQELGHWWDVKLHGTEDTTTADGNAFDEGAAYAERFSEGLQGDALYADYIYQDDHYLLQIDGQTTPVEFRPIGTINMQGATYDEGNQSTWEYVFDVMNGTIAGQTPGAVDLMALQETGEITRAGFGDALNNIGAQEVEVGNTGTQAYVNRYRIDHGGNTFVIFQIPGDLGNTTRNNLAIVVRNPPNQGDTLQSIVVPNPRRDNPNGLYGNTNHRPALGVRIENRVYFTVHAESGNSHNTTNDAEALVDNATGRGLADGDRNVEAVTVLGDFNRNLLHPSFDADINPPNGFGQNTAFEYIGLARGNQRHHVIRPQGNAPTHNAREAAPRGLLDYAIERRADGGDRTTFGLEVLDSLPGARTGAFPSDHFPALFTDTANELSHDSRRHPDAPSLAVPPTVLPQPEGSAEESANSSTNPGVAPPTVPPQPEMSTEQPQGSAEESANPSTNPETPSSPPIFNFPSAEEVDLGEESEETPETEGSFTSALPGGGKLQVAVSAGRLRDTDAERTLTPVEVAKGKTAEDLVAIAGDRNQTYSFYNDGTYSLSSVKEPTDLDAQSERGDDPSVFRYYAPKDRKIVDIASNDEKGTMTAYFDDGTALEANNRTQINFSKGREFRYSVADGYEHSDVRGIGRNEKDDGVVVAFYNDGNYSVGTDDDLDAKEGVQPSDLSKEQAAGLIGISYDNNNAHFWSLVLGLLLTV